MCCPFMKKLRIFLYGILLVVSSGLGGEEGGLGGEGGNGCGGRGILFSFAFLLNQGWGNC